MNIGDSIRSAVSSRRRRRGGEIAGTGDGEAGGEGIDLGSCRVGGCCRAGGGVDMPESERTDSSWSRGGRVEESHSRFLKLISIGDHVEGDLPTFALQGSLLRLFFAHLILSLIFAPGRHLLVDSMVQRLPSLLFLLCP